MPTTPHEDNAVPSTTPLLLILAALPAAAPLPDSRPFAAPDTVEVGPVVPVSPSDGPPVVEPTLAVDPDDPDRMAVAAMTFPAGAEGPVVRAWWSGDGGASWSPAALDSRTARGADPQLAWAPDGRLHLVHLPAAHHVSTDGGRSWRGAGGLPDGSWDYPKLAVDRTGGPHHGRLYVWASSGRRLPDGRRVGPVVLFRTDPGGERFERAAEVLPGDLTYQVGGLTALPDGRLAAALHEIDHRGDYVRHPRLWVVRFRPGGVEPGLPGMARGLFTADSPELIGVPDPENGAPALLLSWTGIPSGTPGEPGRVAVARSEDGGATWGDPVEVDAVPAGHYLPHHGMIAADARGGVLLTWQRPAPERGERCFRLHAAWSPDGGRSFAEPVPVAPAPACADAPGNDRPVGTGPSAFPVGRRYGDGGDYHGLRALPDGGFQVVWADAREGRYRLWTARITREEGR